MFNSKINSVNRVCFTMLLLVYFCTSCLWGQFTIDCHQIGNLSSKIDKKAKVSSAQVYSISSSLLRAALNQKQVDISVSGDLNWKLHLEEIQLLSPSHQAYIYTAAQQSILAGFDSKNINVYTGFIEGNPSSKVSLTLTHNGIEGIIFDGSTSYYLEKAKPEPQSTVIEHILYTADDVTDKSIHCLFNEAKAIEQPSSEQTKKRTGSCLEISLAIAVDYYYYQLYNQDISAIIARSITVMNAVALDYQSQFLDSITFKIVEHFISTCDSCDPWGDNRDAVVLIENFSHWAEDGGFSNSFDLGQLWTGGDLLRDQSSSVVGYAFKAGLCSNKRYHVLEDYSESLWKLRQLTSHEIGHNLNCSHDPVGSSTIMSPTVTNTSVWSPSSISSINSFIGTMSCVANCAASSCYAIDDLTILEYSATMIKLSWTSSNSVFIKMTDTSTGEILYETITNENTLDIPGTFSNCQTLSLAIQTNCGTSVSEIINVALASPHHLALEVLDVKTIQCVPGQSPSYNIQLMLHHNGIIGEQFFVDIDGQTTSFIFGSSPQTIEIDRAQILTPESIQYLQIFSIIDSKLYCLAESVLHNIPNQYCDLYILEDFNDCALPFGWSMTSSNTTYFPFEYAWQFNDGSRKILNYAKANNATTEKTISGNCMAYFDDDINTSPEFTGSLVLNTAIYDISEYQNVSINFTYLFHDFSDIKGSNNSFFSLQIWSNNSWIEVLRENTSPCLWSDVWRSECMDFFSINIDTYAQDQLRCRFIYSDSNEGDWTGMVALDNFTLTGQRQLTFGCTNATSINYDPLADYDDGSCYSCHNAIQDGQETGVDCGGPDCQACPIPCPTQIESITSITTDSIFSDIDEIHISATIDKLQIELKPGKTAIFTPGFEIRSGSTLTVEISPCLEEQ